MRTSGFIIPIFTNTKSIYMNTCNMNTSTCICWRSKRCTWFKSEINHNVKSLIPVSIFLETNDRCMKEWSAFALLSELKSSLAFRIAPSVLLKDCLNYLESTRVSNQWSIHCNMRWTFYFMISFHNYTRICLFSALYSFAYVTYTLLFIEFQILWNQTTLLNIDFRS